MKKIILILVLLLLVSCNDGFKTNTINDVRKIRVGMSTNELKYILGEPKRIKIQNGYEEWSFIYESNTVVNNGLKVEIINNKISDLYSN